MALTNGCNHVALVTNDLDRFLAFYRDVFDAEVVWDLEEGPVRHAMVDLGGGFMLHPFQHADGNIHGAGSTEVFNRGHLDHFALDVADAATFEELRHRLVEHGATDGVLTDFGVTRNVWFEDPDGHGCEIALWCHQEPRTFDDRLVEPYQPRVKEPVQPVG